MKTLIKKINDLKNSEIKSTINKRINEFKKIRKSSASEIFSELCFCLLTANFQAEKSIKIQKEISEYIESSSEEVLAKKLKELGHRFWPQRAKRIVEARAHKNELYSKINKLPEKEIREWILKNINGLGMKESSHFLRNIGYTNLAIIDFHILDLLEENNLIVTPKTLSKNKYEEIEIILNNLAKKVDLNLAELDLYLWYIETGKILK